MIGGRDSPVPIGGYYVCEEADCEKKFKYVISFDPFE